MEYTWIIAVAALIFIPPMILFRPLVNAIANRIAGKGADVQEVKRLKQKVEVLEHELTGLQHRLGAVEDASEFARKLLEDSSKKAAEK